ncbi:MAG TPA: polyribonucleotide nucleotidyltransferase, partial [Victivallales bacterium]|nr:polyribonucleotide nucleotidyltransferase [Victivallales bacterium]
MKKKEGQVSIEIGHEKKIEISTGKIAGLANGSCLVRCGDTVVLVAVCSSKPKEGTDFLPLQVDYREKYSAAGRFPGGYIKREGRPTDREILICRMTDRPVRPLFPEGFFGEVQIQALLLSTDGENDPDILCPLGASAALALSDLPFQGPIGAVRVGLIEGQFIANPTISEMQRSSLNLVYAGLSDKVIMIEGDAKECSEETLLEAMNFANEIIKKQINVQVELTKIAGTPKKDYEICSIPDEINDIVREKEDEITKACVIPGKEERQEALSQILESLDAILKEKYSELIPDYSFKLKIAFDKFVEKTVRKNISEKSLRIDGRKLDELRPIECEVSVLPRVHGSALFSRGETQALMIVTLGSTLDAQEMDNVINTGRDKKFYLHYNFPNFSVGEVGRIAGPGRREIGHGNLAERSIAQVMPSDYPYTVRCVSEIMASNGSTSMATVCSASLALMDAGVPIPEHVAGISCGLIYENENDYVLLTDILGAEDHYGDMDFKVAGTKKGITGFQLDLKIPGVPIDLLYKAMKRNLEARLKIIEIMNNCIPSSRPDISPYAPRIQKIKINPSKIGMLIGPGGANIKAITEKSGAQIDIEDDGTVNIFASNKESL